MRVRIKFCGITREEDARQAVAAGADALGFVFVEGTPRYVSPPVGAAIVASLPPWVTGVGLFVNAPAEEVDHVLQATGLRTVQFHGEESAAYCAEFHGRVKVIKAFRVRNVTMVPPLADYSEVTDAWLLDAFSPGAHGGTGKTFDWSGADAFRGLALPIIVAGGLTPDNVVEAIERFRPYGVDVSSGVESAPGIKDPDRLESFAAAVHRSHFPPFRSPTPA